MRRIGTATAVMLTAMALWSPAPASGQGADGEAAMVAAGQWARGRLPAGELRLDPHRTGRSTERALAGRIASALGAELGTLEQTRTCGNVTDPSTCRMSVPALLAIAPPAIRGDQATVRVYAWYAQDDPRAPVAKESWEVRLRRTGSGWVVDGERRLE
jgi:hypothetical protein